jgi:hypothetical protein
LRDKTAYLAWCGDSSIGNSIPVSEIRVTQHTQRTKHKRLTCPKGIKFENKININIASIRKRLTGIDHAKNFNILKWKKKEFHSFGLSPVIPIIHQ